MSEDLKNYLRRVVGIQNTPDVRIAEIGLETSVNASISAFYLAISKRFEDGATAEDLQQFVARARGTWIKPDGLNPVLAERVLLEAMGTDGLIDDVPIAEITTARNLLTYALVNELGISGAELEQFVLDAIEHLREMDGAE